MKTFLLICSSIFLLQITTSIDAVKLNLESALSQALSNNRQLQQAVDQLVQAQYGIDTAERAFSLSIAPKSQTGYSGGNRVKEGLSIGGGIDFSKKFTCGTLVSVAPTILKLRDHYKSAIHTTLTQPLLRGFGKDFQLAQLKSARFSLRTAYRKLYLARIELILRTVEMLYELTKCEHTVASSLAQSIRMGRFQKAAKIKEQMDLALPAETYRMDNEMRAAEEALKNAQEKLEEARDQLRDQLALPIDADIEVELPIEYTPYPIDVAKAIEIACGHRMEMEQAEDERQESRRLCSLAKKNLLPELDLVFNYTNVGKNKKLANSLQRGRENHWDVGLAACTFSDPMGDAMSYQQSKLTLVSSERAIEQIRTVIGIEVKKAVRQLERRSERISSVESQLKIALADVKIAQAKFSRGLTDQVYLMQAENALRNAQQNHLFAIIDHILGEYQLVAAMGLLADKPCIAK